MCIQTQVSEADFPSFADTTHGKRDLTLFYLCKHAHAYLLDSLEKICQLDFVAVTATNSVRTHRPHLREVDTDVGQTLPYRFNPIPTEHLPASTLADEEPVGENVNLKILLP